MQLSPKLIFLGIAVSNLHYVLYGYIKALVLLLVPNRFRRRKNISGQTVLITGAGSGIGRMMAVEFSKHSVSLVLLDLNKSSLLETEKLLDRGSRTFVYECDVSDRRRVYEVASLIKQEVGKVDILVNNAGIVSGKPFLELEDEKIQKTIEVNTLAHFWMCKAFLPDMVEFNCGHIVCISSFGGISAAAGLTDYCASKFGAVGFMEALTLELASRKLDGIKLTTVCPNLILTGMFAGAKPPLNITLDPVSVAKEVVDAVLLERELVIIPRWISIVIALKSIMPQIATKAFNKDSGVMNIMDHFEGRENAAKYNTRGHT